MLFNGELDPTFGAGGIYEFPDELNPSAIAVDANGKLLVAELGLVWRRRSGGGIDRTYNNGRGAVGLNMSIATIELQKDGKALVAGMSLGNFAVARLTKEGELDRTFGENGYFSLPGYPDSRGEHFSLRSGRIAISGSTNITDGLLVMLDIDGKLDKTFSQDGIATFGNEVISKDVSIGRNGAVTVVLDIQKGAGARVMRMTKSGELDERFSEDGISPLIKSMTYADRFVATDGSVIVAGINVSNEAPLLARITRFGKIDRSFGESGYQILSTPSIVSMGGLQSADGKHYLFGSTGSNLEDTGNDEHIYLARLTVDGRLDELFGEAGVITISPHYQEHPYGAAFTKQSDKLIILGGSFTTGLFSGLKGILARVIL